MRPHALAPLSKEFEFLEFFAGRARTTAAFKEDGKLCAKFDVLYNFPDPGKTNYMDLNCSSGFLHLCCVMALRSKRVSVHPSFVSCAANDHSSRLRLACFYILRGKVGEFIALFAMKCSSFCSMNAGTSKRSICNSVGWSEQPSVAYSNKLLERRGSFENNLDPLYNVDTDAPNYI